MGKPILTRDYRMSDADLIQRADLLEISIKRDGAEFSKRNVSTDRIAVMTDARRIFSEYPTDEELKGIVNQRTLKKDAVRVEAEVAIRSIRGMANTRYGGKGLYKSFKFDDMTHQTDNELVRAGRRVVRVATKLLDDLEAEGLSQANIDALTAITDKLDNGIDACEEAVEDRDIATQRRIMLGNALWKPVSELANIGKSIFEDTDEAKHNDYVLNDEPSAAPPADGD